MIFIVTERGQKQAIMRAIMEKAGMESKDTDIFIFRTGRRSSRAGYVIQIKF